MNKGLQGASDRITYNPHTGSVEGYYLSPERVRILMTPSICTEIPKMTLKVVK